MQLIWEELWCFRSSAVVVLSRLLEQATGPSFQDIPFLSRLLLTCGDEKLVSILRPLGKVPAVLTLVSEEQRSKDFRARLTRCLEVVVMPLFVFPRCFWISSWAQKTVVCEVSRGVQWALLLLGGAETLEERPQLFWVFVIFKIQIQPLKVVPQILRGYRAVTFAFARVVTLACSVSFAWNAFPSIPYVDNLLWSL